jgi:hypothetical protein
MVRGIGVVSEPVVVSPDAITTQTDEVLHYMPTASVPNSLTRSEERNRYRPKRRRAAAEPCSFTYRFTSTLVRRFGSSLVSVSELV